MIFKEIGFKKNFLLYFNQIFFIYMVILAPFKKRDTEILAQVPKIIKIIKVRLTREVARNWGYLA